MFARLVAGFIEVVVVGVDTAVTALTVVVVVELLGDGTTTPDGGRETTPNDALSVGPSGGL